MMSLILRCGIMMSRMVTMTNGVCNHDASDCDDDGFCDARGMPSSEKKMGCTHSLRNLVLALASLKPCRWSERREATPLTHASPCPSATEFLHPLPTAPSTYLPPLSPTHTALAPHLPTLLASSLQACCSLSPLASFPRHFLSLCPPSLLPSPSTPIAVC